MPPTVNISPLNHGLPKLALLSMLKMKTNNAISPTEFARLPYIPIREKNIPNSTIKSIMSMGWCFKEIVITTTKKLIQMLANMVLRRCGKGPGLSVEPTTNAPNGMADNNPKTS